MSEEDTESRPLSPSRKPLALPSISLTGRKPSRQNPPAPLPRSTGVCTVASPSEDLAVPPPRLPTGGSTMGASPTRYPPWAPPRRPSSGWQPAYVRALTALQSQEPSENPNPVPAPEKTAEMLCHIPTAQPESIPSYSTARKKRKSIESSPPAPSSKRRKRSGSQESEQHLGLSSPDGPEEKQEMAEKGLDYTCSSPCCEPQPPLVPIWTGRSGKVYYGLTHDRKTLDAYHRASREYQQEQVRQEQLLTLKFSRSASVEAYSPKQKQKFLNVAKSVVVLSSHLDKEELNRCSGIILEYDTIKGSTIVLTSASLVCKDKPFDDWSERDYVPKAKVIVHLLDGTTVDAQLLYLSEHYDIAFYEIFGDSDFQILPMELNLEYDQDLCVIARDNNMGLICNSVKVMYTDPCEYQHNHYQFISGSIPKCGSGGALVDFKGKMLGMSFCTLPLTAFIPSSFILKCLRLGRKFGRLARPELGLKLGTVGFLNTADIELLSCTYGFSSGLIVGEISAQCAAERSGVRVGDIIFSCQGHNISTLAELEEILINVGEEHLENNNDLSLKVDVEIGVFHVRERVQRIIHLNVHLSDGNEVFHTDDRR